MADLAMTLRRRAVAGALTLGEDEAARHGVFVAEGTIEIEGARHEAGEGVFAAGRARLSGPGTILQFTLAPHEAGDTFDAGDLAGAGGAEGDPVLAARFEHPGGEALLRLDQVSFPPRARAYRHVHPGPGIRALVRGTLEIASDHDVTVFEAGEAWFEDAHSPVQATAGKGDGEGNGAAFVRMMVLPVAYEGRPTIAILDPADAARPTLQTNRRFFDRRVQLDRSARSSSDRLRSASDR